MNTLNVCKTGMYLFGALLVCTPGISNAGNERLLSEHGWVMVEASSQSSQAYMGTSLRSNSQDALGFSDPRAGQSDYASGSYIGTSMKADTDEGLGFTDPRPGE